MKRDVFSFVSSYVIKHLCKLAPKATFSSGVVEFGLRLLFSSWEFFWFEFKKLDRILVSATAVFFFVLNAFVNSLIDDIEHKYTGRCRTAPGER